EFGDAQGGDAAGVVVGSGDVGVVFEEHFGDLYGAGQRRPVQGRHAEEVFAVDGGAEFEEGAGGFGVAHAGGLVERGLSLGIGLLHVASIHSAIADGVVAVEGRVRVDGGQLGGEAGIVFGFLQVHQRAHFVACAHGRAGEGRLAHLVDCV